MMLKKTMVLLVVLTLVVGLGVGCKPAAEPTDETPTETTPTEPPAESGGPVGQVIRYNQFSEPETLDAAKATGVGEGVVLNALFEGLIRLDNEVPTPGMAEEWGSEDGVVWTFKLRKDAKWSNGDPVTAHDFVYSYQRVLDPATAADYAYQMYYLKNGEAINAGEMDVSELGVEAVSDYELKITLEYPTPYFESLLAFTTYLPVHKATVEEYGDEYSGEAEYLTTNGPFILQEWRHNDALILVPNEDYWDREAVKLERLELLCVNDTNTELAMFETDELDILDGIPLEEMDRLKEQGLILGAECGTYYGLFNVEVFPFDDVRVRKAFTYAINRQAIIDNVVKGGQKPALAYVPYGMLNPVTGKDFREEGGLYFKDNDVESATALLTEAGYYDAETGKTVDLPTIEILTNDYTSHPPI